MFQGHKNLLSGQVLIELLLAFAVSSVALVSMAQVATKSVGNANYAKNRSEANKHAVEAIEWIRLQRTKLGWSKFVALNGIVCLPDDLDVTVGLSATPTYGACSSTNTVSSWTYCASEGTTCTFAGSLNVRYGANETFFYKTLSSPVDCTNALGVNNNPNPAWGDPLVGTFKHCDVQSGTGNSLFKRQAAFTPTGTGQQQVTLTVLWSDKLGVQNSTQTIVFKQY